MNDFDAKLAAHEAGQAKLRWEDIDARLKQGGLSPELAKRIMAINVFTLASRPPEWGQTPNEAGQNQGTGVLAGFRENEGDVAQLGGILSRVKDVASVNALRSAFPVKNTVTIQTLEGRSVEVPLEIFKSALPSSGYIGEGLPNMRGMEGGVKDLGSNQFALNPSNEENGGSTLVYKDQSGVAHNIAPQALKAQVTAVDTQLNAIGEVNKSFNPAYSPGEIKTKDRKKRQEATRNVALVVGAGVAAPYVTTALSGGAGGAGAAAGSGVGLTTAALPAASTIAAAPLAAAASTAAPSLLSSILTSAAAAAAPAIVGQIAGRGGQQRADAAMGQVNNAAAMGMDIAGRQASMGEDMWNTYKEKYGKLQDDITGDALKGQGPYQSNANEMKSIGRRLDSFQGQGPYKSNAAEMKGIGLRLDSFKGRRDNSDIDGFNIDSLQRRRTGVDSSQYGADPRVESEVGKAVTDVRNTYRKNRGAENSRMQMYGVDPNSSRFAGLNRELDLNQAADESATGTRTRAGLSEYYDNRDWNRMGELDERDESTQKYFDARDWGREGELDARDLDLSSALDTRDYSRAVGLDDRDYSRTERADARDYSRAEGLDNRDYGRAAGLDERDFNRSNAMTQQDRQYKLNALGQGMALPGAASGSLGAAGGTARGSAQLYGGVANSNIADASANAQVWGDVAANVIKAVPWSAGKTQTATGVAPGEQVGFNGAPMMVNLPGGGQADISGQPPSPRGVRRRFAEGGLVEASGQGYGLRPMRQVMGNPSVVDSVPAVVDGQELAALNHGEIIWPRDVSEYYGTKTFNEMVIKARKAMQQERG